MHRPNITSIIEFVAEFFSELSPTVIAALSGISIFSIIALCGYGMAYIVGFFAYAITQSGMFTLISFIACIAIGCLLGLYNGYRIYKNIKLGYEHHQAE